MQKTILKIGRQYPSHPVDVKKCYTFITYVDVKSNEQRQQDITGLTSL
jgi:hypothetical protein